MCEKPAIDGVVHPKCRTRYCLDGLYSFFHYDGTVRHVVKALKYRRIFDCAKESMDLVSQWAYTRCIQRIQPSDDMCIFPIPLYSAREKQRGFNQSVMLGRIAAEKLHIPIATDILYRTKNTVPQVEMKDRKDRLENMKGVFGVREGTCVLPHAVILLDDVWTTGATMRAAANVLKRHKVHTVWAITFAR